jgi:two-component sensor histidine kinase
LISIVLAPYDDMGAFSGRIRVAVERMGVGEAAATSLALILHELATNAVKYGALSVPGGRLDISTTSMGDEVMLVWLERGGPAVKEPTEPAGFGSRLIERAVSRQLRGSIEHDWSEGGLIVTLRVSRARLTL